jgi:hypothetical protein
MTDNERTTRAAAAEDRRHLLSADEPDEMGRELARGLPRLSQADPG